MKNYLHCSLMETNCVLCEVRDETEETANGLNITIEDHQL